MGELAIVPTCETKKYLVSAVDHRLITEEQTMILRAFAMSCFFAAAATTGCATGHTVMRGSVVMKIDPTTAHVCLGSGEVAANDRVRLYRNVCEPSGRRTICKKETVADGKVTEILDEHYSVVTFSAGTTFEEGNTIEKL
jgi:hypothetical protein